MIPSDVDCIVLGTGLTNSIVAAACSRIGKSVLHIDRNSYYGDEWASFTFQQLTDWIRDNYPDDESLKAIPQEVENKSRLFCIDLCPRLLYSNGPMVELLVKSNVSRYHEFKNNLRILSIVDGAIQILPCRRSDIFTSPLLPDLIDKRRLMKFIETCVKLDEGDTSEQHSDIIKQSERPIEEFLIENGLNPTLRAFIVNSIAMVEPKTPTLEACKKIKEFMIATQRYGKTPFLFPIYGCGEFAQSFCRLSAVFGGTYCLNTKVKSVIFEPPNDTTVSNASQGKFIVTLEENNHEVRSDVFVTDHASASSLSLVDRAQPSKTSRCILITNKSVIPNEENNMSFLRIMPDDKNPKQVYMLELNSSVMVCPPEMNLVYLWTESTSSANEDLEASVERLFGVQKECILWQFYFQTATCSNCLKSTMGSEKMIITQPQCDDIDFKHCIEEAQQIFAKIFPGEDFLPRAPDPDEIA